LWSLTIIVITGAAVRLTGSGLGCSDWPNCEEDQFVSDLSFHPAIEFGNRMFTGVVTIAVIAAVLGSLRRVPRRTDLVWLSWGLVAGVLAQIVLGGLLVRTELDPRFTMGHFLLSMVLLWNAAVLMHRAAQPEQVAVASWEWDMDAATSHARLLRPAGRIALLAGGVVLVLGTIVTGSGPHSGSDEAEVAERLPFALREVTRLHSLAGLIFLLGLAGILLYARKHNRVRVVAAAQVVVSLIGAQIIVGYWQYFTGVPVLLVGIHVAVATLTWISLVRLELETRRTSMPESVLAKLP
jgi:cytochrome c oxidase assembly protein subunit 15